MLTPEQNDAIFGPSIRVFRFKSTNGNMPEHAIGHGRVRVTARGLNKPCTTLSLTQSM